MHETVSAVMNEKVAAIYLGVQPKTLQNWRWKRKGPAYIKIGRLVG